MRFDVGSYWIGFGTAMAVCAFGRLLGKLTYRIVTAKHRRDGER